MDLQTYAVTETVRGLVPGRPDRIPGQLVEIRRQGADRDRVATPGLYVVDHRV